MSSLFAAFAEMFKGTIWGHSVWAVRDDDPRAEEALPAGYPNLTSDTILCSHYAFLGKRLTFAPEHLRKVRRSASKGVGLRVVVAPFEI